MIESIDMDYKITVFAVDIEGKHKHFLKISLIYVLKIPKI